MPEYDYVKALLLAEYQKRLFDSISVKNSVIAVVGQDQKELVDSLVKNAFFNIGTKQIQA